VVGRLTIVHFDGTSWQLQPNHSRSGIFDVAGSGARDVYAVGSYRTIQRWDGARWTLEHFDEASGLRQGHLDRLLILGAGRACASGSELWCRAEGTWKPVARAEARALTRRAAAAVPMGKELPCPAPRYPAQEAGPGLWLVECESRQLHLRTNGSWQALGRPIRWWDTFAVHTAFALGADQVFVAMNDRSLQLFDGSRWRELDTGLRRQPNGALDLWFDGQWLYVTARDRVLRRQLRSSPGAPFRLQRLNVLP